MGVDAEMRKWKFIYFAVLLISVMSPWCEAKELVTVGSKIFTEGYILGEIVAQTLEADKDLGDIKIDRRLGMGATGILVQALESGEISLYTEYAGTVSETVLKNTKLVKFEDIQAELAKKKLVMSQSLGFNNTYALAARREFAEKNGLRKISDLRKLPVKSRVGFSHEFMTRDDGYTGIQKAYGLSIDKNISTIAHTLGYEAIGKGELDITDVYSTDAKIKTLDLVVLEDDLAFFPRYDAVVLARVEFTEKYPKLWAQIRKLENAISPAKMRELNAMVDEDRKSFATAASAFLGTSSAPGAGSRTGSGAESFISKGRLIERTLEHLKLVGTALLFSIFIGIPLGIISSGNRILGQAILLLSGVVQTIPSLALLCFLIPAFGIGFGSAIVALCLYGLLPVVMNTFTGLRSIDPILLETAEALGLNQWQSLVRIRMPLASRSILSGVKTSAIVGIGTATLAALIGAGGYGATILSGLATNDNGTILMGAAPAALMALGAYGIFDIFDRILIPKGLR